MKKILFIVLAILMTAGFFTVSNAASAVITERPDIVITIDGVTNSYSNTPIIVNGRTLLPLRELLMNLGVSNDDQHIIWNGKENSVTAIKDSIQIYLKVGSIDAKVNGKAVTIDAAPVNYKGRVYIPARFAAEAFDKVVLWDRKGNRIFIKDKTEYDEIKKILENSVALMDGLNKCEEHVTVESRNTTLSGQVGKLDFTSIAQTDVRNRIVYVKTEYQGITLEDGKPLTGDYYVFNQMSYERLSVEEEWTKEELTDYEFNEYFCNYIELGDILYAALSIDKNQSGNTICLSGDVDLNYYYIEDDPTEEVLYNDCSCEIFIDQATGYIEQINVKRKAKISPPFEQAYILDFESECVVSDLSGDFTINIPDEIKN